MTSPQPEGAEEPKPGGASEAQDAEAGNEDGQPQEVTRYVHEAMAMIAGPALNPLLNKLGPEHLSKAMDHSHDLEKEEVKTRRSGRWFQLGYVLLAAAVFVFLTIYLHQIGQPVTFQEIIKGVAIFSAATGTLGTEAAGPRARTGSDPRSYGKRIARHPSDLQRRARATDMLL